MSAPDRQAYAARQAQLLDSLLRGNDPPPGFDTAQADAAGSSLRRKRGRAVARAWPALALSLGDEFDTRFDASARGGDLDDTGQPLRDGLAFAHWLAADRAPVADAVRIEVLLARAALRPRGIWVAAARLRHPHPRLLVVARLPLAGRLQHSISLRMGGRRYQPDAKRTARCSQAPSY